MLRSALHGLLVVQDRARRLRRLLHCRALAHDFLLRGLQWLYTSGGFFDLLLRGDVAGLRSGRVRFAVVLQPAVETVFHVVEERVAVDAHLVVGYDLLFLPAEPDPREERVLVDVSLDLVQDRVRHLLGRLLSLRF